jgi:dTDP-4-amino-4,6-dideoxygalactose transaminase
LSDGSPLLAHGDLSMLSFHATKAFHTVEGGALIAKDGAMKRHIDSLINFGIRDETTIIDYGVNGKMNELIAAFGLLTLDGVEESIAKRGVISARYRARLDGLTGITIPEWPQGVTCNHGYFPILVEKEYSMDRNTLYRELLSHDILSRPYFYPLLSNTPLYDSIPSSAANKLPVANRIADKILCLPIYESLKLDDVDRICDQLKGFNR